MVTPFRIDPDTLDRLVDRIVFEMAEDRDSTVLRDVLAGQVAIVTQLETENAALVAFVEAYDAHQAFRETTPEDGYELWIAKWEHLKCKAKEARQTLATDHGIPLPGEGAS